MLASLGSFVSWLRNFSRFFSCCTIPISTEVGITASGPTLKIMGGFVYRCRAVGSEAGSVRSLLVQFCAVWRWPVVDYAIIKQMSYNADKLCFWVKRC